MAIEHYVDENEGLFGERHKVKVTGADMEHFLKQIPESYRPERLFDDIEREALAVLGKYGYPEWPARHPAKEEVRKRIKHAEDMGVPKTAPRAARDAHFLLFRLRTVREQIEKCESPGAAATVAMNAIRLGMEVQLMELRMFEPHAERGIKTVQSAADGHVAVHGTPEQKQARWQEYRLRWQTVKSENPHLKVQAIDNIVAGAFGVCGKTIQRARQRKQDNN